MNTAQDSKYWRRWAAVVRANQWRMVEGRLSPEARRTGDPFVEAVARIAAGLADQAHRAVVPDDLRHACHIHAAGRDLPHKKMNDPQFDRLLLLWGNEREFPGLLIYPDHLASVMAWENPDEAARASTVAYLRQLAPDNVITAVASGAGMGGDWESLGREKLLELGRILRARGARRKAIEKPEEVDPENVPF